MPILQVDQTGLICVAIIIGVVMLGMLWVIYSQSCRLSYYRLKSQDVEGEQTTKKSPVGTSPALDKKLELGSPTTANQEDDSQEANYIIQSKHSQVIPWSETRTTRVTLDPTSPDDWDLSFIVPTTKPSSSPGVFYRATAVPKGGIMLLHLVRFEDAEVDGHTLVRMRLSPGKEKTEMGTVTNAKLSRPVLVAPRETDILPSAWVHLQKSA